VKIFDAVQRTLMLFTLAREDPSYQAKIRTSEVASDLVFPPINNNFPFLHNSTNNTLAKAL
jgi:hypothetical protein